MYIINKRYMFDTTNPEYEPIPMDESIRCNGRVIGILDPEWIVEK